MQNSIPFKYLCTNTSEEKCRGKGKSGGAVSVYILCEKRYLANWEYNGQSQFFENKSYLYTSRKGYLQCLVGCHSSCLPHDPVGGVAKVAHLLSAYCSTVSELQLTS